ncbi:Protein of unknown function [Granulicella rosea]|uniref:DUF3592 domain-containing protein n=1 Tax=Granulicella rosea TaxID=474952 RepID=A0A239LCN9_9BACT|nr:DUF3592 domain-containing protein [Granulicella rosea]SNT27399.1 Protein of unknown function [Granulicella rosea]
MFLIGDNLIVFLYRWIVVGIGVFRSRHWPIVLATVEKSCKDESAYPFVDLTYAYTNGEERHTGTYRKGFWYRSSARAFAKSFFPGMPLAIRYNPADPAESFLREGDQRPALLHQLETE